MEGDDADLDAGLVTHFLVREYLARTSRQALATLDAVRPPTATDVSNKSDVVKHLRLDRALRTNRSRTRPMATLLEVLVAEHRTIVEPDETDDEDEDDSDDSDKHLPRLRSAKPTMPPLAAPVTIALPSGGPLAANSRAQPARSARPASARPGSARTPNVGPFGGVTCSELPPTAKAFENRGGGGASSSSSAAASAVAKEVSFIGERGKQLVVPPGGVNGGSVELLELERCEVLVLDWASQVIVEGCRHCTVLIGPVDGSVMVRDSTHVQLHAVCRQLRTRDCTDCGLHLFTLGPAIESSSRITVAPWASSYPQLGAHFGAAKLDPTAINQWAEVHDFNDPDKTATPPNWTAGPVVPWAVAVVPGDVDGTQYGHGENPVTSPITPGVAMTTAPTRMADVSDAAGATPTANVPMRQAGAEKFAPSPPSASQPQEAGTATAAASAADLELVHQAGVERVLSGRPLANTGPVTEAIARVEAARGHLEQEDPKATPEVTDRGRDVVDVVDDQVDTMPSLS